MLHHIVLTDTLTRTDQPTLCVVLREELNAVRITICHRHATNDGDTVRVLTDPAGSVDAEVAVELGDLLGAVRLLRGSHTRAEERLDLEAALTRDPGDKTELERLRQTLTDANTRIANLVARLSEAEDELAGFYTASTIPAPADDPDADHEYTTTPDIDITTKDDAAAGVSTMSRPREAVLANIEASKQEQHHWWQIRENIHRLYSELGCPEEAVDILLTWASKELATYTSSILHAQEWLEADQESGGSH